MNYDYAKIQENCEIMIKIIDALRGCEKGDLNDVALSFDTCREDLSQSLNTEEK